MKKALIAMSGGVDSSVSALLTIKEGYTCEGVTMRLFNKEQESEKLCKTCCSDKDIEDAMRVTNRMGIPYTVVDYTVDFKEKIIEKFVCTYEQGGTPNPCIDCNRYMKFEKLFEAARSRGCDKVVTGHYARIEYDSEKERYLLKKAVDSTKDQSYVLYNLTQEQLAHVYFPLGGMTKASVREIAQREGFVNADKADSQDICFVPDGDYAGFIEAYRGQALKSGNFVDMHGNILGQHKGIVHYTIGQRKGLGIASSAPLFVTRIDPQRNEIVLTHGDGLFSDTLYATDVNLISVPRIEGQMRISAKVRYRQKEQPAVVTQLEDGRIKVKFDEPQRAITKGQAVVLYDGDIVVGGGTII
ncbi:tRNA 2-thiouridine(34) synthase MnmA [Eubacterium oxidoreducens]|uniref:tRNA-specific 2-thiouridylase MnmA n=1 Tax=Eubacterium oxidoreducens TaxID=1732 RepID=A0A1G6CHE9_EUBOX|nr:tRNA 2-thiouridine(34) synthase MnmA [Eubacterium oxidoreducens]SDB32261.1 tRNA-specific 2-thiouridylase [Eubacterium oxidoreducens]